MMKKCKIDKRKLHIIDEKQEKIAMHKIPKPVQENTPDKK